MQGLGYAHILQVTTLKAIIDILDYDPQLKVRAHAGFQSVDRLTRLSSAPTLQVDIIRLKLQLQACPDSLTTFGAIVGDLAKVLARYVPPLPSSSSSA